jgi:hypothetical protein
MRMHQIKKPLYIRGDNHENEETANRMGEINASYSLDKGLASRVYKELKKLNIKEKSN